MDVADQLPEKDILLEVQNGIIGFSRERIVNEFKHDAGAEKQKNEAPGHAAKPQGKGKAQGALVYRPGPEMQQQAVQKFF